MGKIFELYRKMAAGGGLFPDGPRAFLIVQGQTLSFEVTGSGTLKLNTGDGSILTARLPPTGHTDMSHQYTSAQTWEVKQLGGSITHLTWKGGDVVSMDMNGNPQLQFLECVVSTLVGLDVTGCTELRYLRVSNTALTSLNLSTNTKLRALEANKTKITQLDFTNNPLLDFLSCSGETDGSASLEAVDVTACSKLVSLNVRYNQLTELNIMNNPKLELLFADHNHLTSLRLAEGVVLKNVDLTGNSLDSTSIDHILLRLSQNGLENGEALLNQTPPAPPGSQGETAKQTLLQRGWTLQTD